MSTESLLHSLTRRIKRLLHIKAHKDASSIRWGIIGLGHMAQVFADALNGNSGSILVAVASRSLDKAIIFARRNGVAKAYGSYEDMLSDKDLELDVVYVATPVKCHYDNIKSCLVAKKNVLCEKPAASTAAEFSDLIHLAEQNDCFLMEGMWMKCLPVFRKAKEWLSQGRIGNLKLIRADLYKREQIIPNRAIFNSEYGGGVIHDYGVYAIAFANMFIPVIDDIEVHSITSSYGLDSDWQLYMKGVGVQAFINLSSNFGSLSKAALIGDDGFIEFGSQFNRTNAISLYAKDGTHIETIQYVYKFDGFEYEIDEVNAMIRLRERQSQMVKLVDTLSVLDIIDRITHDE